MFKKFMEKPKKTRVTIIVASLAVLFLILLAALAGVIFPNSLFSRIIDNSIGKFFNLADFFVNNYVRILESLAVLFFVWLLNKLINVIAAIFIKKGGKTEMISELIQSLIKYASIAAALFLILSAWGVQTQTLLAGAGIIALAISFGAQSLIEDIISGLFIIFEKQFSIGDIVQLNDFRGNVVTMGIRTTKFEDVNGDIKIINNSDIRGAINTTTNLSPAVCDISISYSEDIIKVEEVIKSNISRIKTNIPDIIEGPFYKGVQSLADSSVVIRMYAKCKEQNRYQVVRDLNREMKIIFDENKISIPFPQLVVHTEEKKEDK
ncbi:MAG: putative MscS family protein YkuT [Firmicutes bacterium ADurb.Bin080]|nr:MAG: putative MscS family protein YkuT [Firmicutes bacterium ADurb.Bin080]